MKRTYPALPTPAACDCCAAPAVWIDPATCDPLCASCLRDRAKHLRQSARLVSRVARALPAPRLLRTATA